LHRTVLTTALFVLTPLLGHASTGVAPESTCTTAPVTGFVRDTTAAIIPGATLTLDNNKPVISASDGAFRLPCFSPGQHHLHIEAASFATSDITLTAPLRQPELKVILQPSEVNTTVDVTAETDLVPSVNSSGPTETIAGTRLQSLADDPDDLLRELQQMAAADGGTPGNATIGIDGFSGNGEGGTTLPPKSSIAYIKVNPDLFSSEYRDPPFGGGEIQIYTKPGQPTFHGALFTTNSSSWMNARDPFSTGNAPIGKQRYGFEFSGPILKKGSDFSLNLEHRAINNLAAVNAFTADASGNPVAFSQTVPANQALWIGLARADWQLGSKNTVTGSFSSNDNHFTNLGVGGTTLPEAGFDEFRYEHIIHLTDLTTVSPKLMNELRVGIMLDGRTDTPNSSAPSISVSGAFTGGGATVGTKRLNEKYNTLDDDIILTTGNHLIKTGIQTEFLNQHKRLPINFNGTYTFGGTATQTALQQYASSLNGTATPTNFSDTEGNPEIDFVQIRIAAFFQDDWKIRPNLHLSYGLRYYGQDDPRLVHNYTPRVGLSWSPDKKATTTLHAHAGMFTGRITSGPWAQFLGQDGVERITSTVYSPSAYCPGGVSTGCNPFNNAVTLHTINTLQPNFPNTYYGLEEIGFSHTFPKSWTLSGSFDIAQFWHYARTENINSPTNGQPTGPRPSTPNLNILQLQGTGRGYGNVAFAGLEQHSIKRIQFFMGAVREDIIDDTGDSLFLTPQTTGVNTGEYARRPNNALWNVFGNFTLTLPAKIRLSSNFSASGGAPYNITTGNDNNGDGDFNDRPRYAPSGTPLCVVSPNSIPCAYNTHWGLLTNTGNYPTLARDKGVQPWTYYLDTNLARTFNLPHNVKSEHPQSLTANLRSSNILNHRNITAVGGVLGSPLFGVPYAADPGRRIEAGLRYTF
jgi:hypothetical protein